MPLASAACRGGCVSSVRLKARQRDTASCTTTDPDTYGMMPNINADTALRLPPRVSSAAPTAPASRMTRTAEGTTPGRVTSVPIRKMAATRTRTQIESDRVDNQPAAALRQMAPDPPCRTSSTTSSAIVSAIPIRFSSRICLPSAAAPRRGTQRAALVDAAVLHHHLDARQRGDVEQRVAVDDDHVGELAGLDRPELAALADDLRVDAGRGRDGPARPHAHVDVHLDLAPQCLAVEVHRRARVGAHSHHRARLDEL